MAGKRVAEDELNHDNWDKDDDGEKEEAGQFRYASDDVLQKRTFKKAKRKTTGDGTPSKNLFQGFSFSNNSTNNAPSFSFLPASSTSQSVKKDNKDVASPPSTSSNIKLDAKTSSTSSGDGLSNVVTFANDEKSETNYQMEIRKLNESFLQWVTHHVKQNPYCILTPTLRDYNDYISELDKDYPCPSSQESADEDNDIKLKNDDKSSKLTRSPLRKNVAFALEPIIEESKQLTSTSSSSSTTVTTASSNLFSFGSGASSKLFNFGAAAASAAFTATTRTSSGFTFGSTTTSSTTSSSSLFNFKADDDDKKEVDSLKNEDKVTKNDSDSVTKPAFVFGSVKFNSSQDQSASQSTNKSEAPTTNQLFTFSNVTPFSFGSSSSTAFNKGFFSKPTTSSEGGAEGGGGGGGFTASGEKEEDYEPPKVEVVETKEEGAFYSIRCKLYYKKGEKYEERGIGFLHLKPNGNKTQLIIRTDTALGNILLNINVDKLMPISRQGVNNVNLVCIPNPPIDAKKPSKTPIPMLIRVKTKDNADELFKHLTDSQAKL